MIKYTIQEWLSPNGNKINEVGVKPDIAIEQNSAYYSEPSIENDVQLQKALEVLVNKRRITYPPCCIH